MKLAFSAAFFAFAATFMSLSASAATVFSLNVNSCSVGCDVTPAGTVTLTDIIAGTVRINIDLVDDYALRQANDDNHWTLVFNLSNAPDTPLAIDYGTFTADGTELTFAGLAGGAGPTSGRYNQVDFGTFSHAVSATKGKDKGLTPVQHLSFEISGIGLTLASFIANGVEPDNFFVGVDVVGLTEAAGIGLTGNFASTTGNTVDGGVPEPSSALLLGLGLTALASWYRRRKT